MEQWTIAPMPEYLYNNSTNHPNDLQQHAPHYAQQADMTRREQPMDFRAYGAQQQSSQQQQQQQHQQQHQQPPPPQHQQHQHYAAPPVQQQQQPPMAHAQQAQAQAQPPPPQQLTPTPAPAPNPQRGRKRNAPGAHPPAHQAQHAPQHAQHAPQHVQHPQHAPQHQAHQTQHAPVAPPAQQQQPPQPVQQAPVAPPQVPQQVPVQQQQPQQQPAPQQQQQPQHQQQQQVPAAAPAQPQPAAPPAQPTPTDESTATPNPPAKKSRTNTPWTPNEEHRLKQMRDAGISWAEIAKKFPSRTEGSVKKHWYKDMHYAEFAEDEKQNLLNAIKEYENNKWKTIGQKVGKPAKACEQFAKEHFPDLFAAPKGR